MTQTTLSPSDIESVEYCIQERLNEILAGLEIPGINGVCVRGYVPLDDFDTKAGYLFSCMSDNSYISGRAQASGNESTYALMNLVAGAAVREIAFKQLLYQRPDRAFAMAAMGLQRNYPAAKSLEEAYRLMLKDRRSYRLHRMWTDILYYINPKNWLVERLGASCRENYF